MLAGDVLRSLMSESMKVKQTMADEVRKLATDQYVLPARSACKRTVQINVGEVHKAMGYKSRVPLVATALGAMKFRNENNMELYRTGGPGQSTTTTYVFRLK